MTTSAATTYQLDGRLLEVCTCEVICPCWVGADPDGGTCDSALGWHIDSGTIQGVDVSGLTIAISVHIPGNVLKGNWRALVYVDDQSTQAQQDALLSVFTGQLGGPVADLVSLIGEVIGVERVPITFTVDKGKGTLLIGQTVQAELVPLTGPTGELTTLHESIFSTIPGSPAYVSRAEHFRSQVPALGHDLTIQNHNAVQGTFHFAG
ncbi:MAG TPA: DUF1326 domain-containing protein [Ktedonobacteraceae bacterium]